MAYFILLATLYGLAAFVLSLNTKMPFGIKMMLVSPLALASLLYIFAIFIEVPHFSFIVAQSAFLASIIVISIFEKRDMRK